jgi:hypothetical protein
VAVVAANVASVGGEPEPDDRSLQEQIEDYEQDAECGPPAGAC